jgi:hypothetical protein
MNERSELASAGPETNRWYPFERRGRPREPSKWARHSGLRPRVSLGFVVADAVQRTCESHDAPPIIAESKLIFCRIDGPLTAVEVR